MRLCLAALFLLPHDPVLVQKRDRSGKLIKPHAVIWECRLCHRVIGETTLPVRWRMQVNLLRQARDLAEQRRREA